MVVLFRYYVNNTMVFCTMTYNPPPADAASGASGLHRQCSNLTGQRTIGGEKVHTIVAGVKHQQLISRGRAQVHRTSAQKPHSQHLGRNPEAPSAYW